MSPGPKVPRTLARRVGLCGAALAACLFWVGRAAAQDTSTSAADTTTVPASVRAMIDSVNADWIPALQRGDAAAIAEPYADDGVLMTATGETVRGRAAVEAAMRASITRTAGAQIAGRLVQDGLTRSGDFIYEWGHAELEVSRPGAQAAHVTGRYLTVWRRESSGRWRILRNLSLP